MVINYMGQVVPFGSLVLTPLLISPRSVPQGMKVYGVCIIFCGAGNLWLHLHGDADHSDLLV